jgi:hypothetical protein
MTSLVNRIADRCEAYAQRLPYAESSGIRKLKITIAAAARFHFDEKASAYLGQIRQQIARDPAIGAHVYMPAGLCFFDILAGVAYDAPEDFKRARWGVLYIGETQHDTTAEQRLVEGSTQEGKLLVFFYFTENPVIVPVDVCQGSDGWSFSIPGADQVLDQTGATEGDLISLVNDAVMLVVAAALVLGSPKVYEVREADLTKLNKARVRRGKPPLLSQRDVILRVPNFGAHHSSGASDGAGEHSGRVRHLVRAFTRIRRGKLEFVRPHWRGDEGRGVKAPAYSAKG